jgi:hypothetical protein
VNQNRIKEGDRVTVDHDWAHPAVVMEVSGQLAYIRVGIDYYQWIELDRLDVILA